ncbi:hypothetical protein [Colwellia sp. RSH04]|uniref:spermine/spermidine synthase domain-containing protein n=1 Tax=Colwellia sp. RSH04 TaxID=2305464 RepID=UPI000E5744B1|nr:hypothetical protein [Colwellia sp. RSH04]RHW77841.1 hypothetical protein D1094_02640 [Colwellia sp. RSH04]
MQLEKHLAQGRLVYLSQADDAISVSENDYFRWMSFSNVVQSVMHKRKPWQLTLPHQTVLLLPLLFYRPTTILQLGLGGGNLDRFLIHLSSQISLTSVEMSSKVIECFNQYFNPEEASIDIINNDGLLWLENQEANDFDWIICDIYKDDSQPFSHTIEQLEIITYNIDSHACASINLPDVSDDEINLALTVLQQLLPEHQLVYFHIPNYLNIVIHLCPHTWQINSLVKGNKASYLSKRVYNRWRNFWSHGNQVK